MIENGRIWFIVAIILFLVLAFWKIKKWWKTFLQKRRFKRGNEREIKAESWLKKKGFKILTHNKSYNYSCFENKNEITIKITLDYEVEKNGNKYIVEVKTGKSATTIKNAATRRQILEYATIVPNDGIYLLDMETREMKLIQFRRG